ncbi:MAG TPA: hypothetical protein VM492_17880 [Sumerlaeia bacterium]|nr:hypothetical protein [Sumerlaeia bacterium]
MYLKRSRRKKKGGTYESWSLAESVRTSRGPRQRVVATLGKLPGLEEEARVGWEHIGDILDGKARTADFFGFPPDPPEWARVNLKDLRASWLVGTPKAMLKEFERELLDEMREVRSLDVVLPTPVGPELRLRTVSQPEQGLAILLERLEFPLPNRPKKIQNVVATFPPQIQKSEELERFRL